MLTSHKSLEISVGCILCNLLFWPCNKGALLKIMGRAVCNTIQNITTIIFSQVKLKHFLKFKKIKKLKKINCQHSFGQQSTNCACLKNELCKSLYNTRDGRPAKSVIVLSFFVAYIWFPVSLWNVSQLGWRRILKWVAAVKFLENLYSWWALLWNFKENVFSRILVWLHWSLTHWWFVLFSS